MRYLLTGKEMKRWEARMMEKYKIPSILLMEKAAGAVVEELFTGVYDLGRVLIVCGTGNNGGDGLAAARLLMAKDVCPEVCILGDRSRFSPEAKIQFEMYQALGGKFRDIPRFEDYTVIVDALFGIGCNREITGKTAEVIRKINAGKAKTVAVDVPSGISADTGKVCGTAVKADTTVTFFAEKAGMAFYPGRDYCGKIKIASLEMPFDKTGDCSLMTFEEEDIRRLPQRRENSHKGTYGKVLIIAGSPKICGAAYFAAAAAYKAGAGLVKVYTPEQNRCAMQVLLPEALLEVYDWEHPVLKQLNDSIQWADTVVIGPGISTDAMAEKILNYALHKAKVPMVVDADGINLLAGNKNWLYEGEAPVILTPHIQEMARLVECPKEELIGNQITAAKEFTQKYPVVLVLKDARTIVSKKDEETYINMCGNSGMATGGSGDVLAGMIGSFLAQGMEEADASRLAVYLHGRAGDAAARKKGAYSMTAADILDGIAEVTKL